METRIRLALVFGGLPEPELQHRVTLDGKAYYLDLAYPQLRLAIEYDGAEHRTQRRAQQDLAREAALTRAGWTVLRFAAAPYSVARTSSSPLSRRTRHRSERSLRAVVA